MNKELNLKIEDLFRWKGELEITDDEGNVIETLYQRVIGDSEIQKARTEALKTSKLLRKALRDETTDEYIVNIPLKDDYTHEELIALIIFSKYTIFRQQAEYRVKEEKVRDPKGELTLEQQENYIADIEKAKEDYELAVNKDIEKQSKKFEAEYKDKTYEEVFNIYLKEYVDLLCRYKMMEVFDEHSVFYGTFKDEKHKERRFNSIEDFKNLSPRIKQKITSNYKNLELNLNEVKK